MRRRAKVDLNHAEFVRTLRGCGLSVADISGVGHGLHDLIVGSPDGNLLVEVKAPGKLKRVTPDEVEFQANWQGPQIMTEHVEDVLAWFGLI